MGLIERIGGKKICLDTAPVIYFIEEHKKYLGIIEPVFQAIERGEIEAVTSTVTLLEVLVMPLKKGETELARSYRDILLHSKGLSTRILSHEISERAAALRAKYAIRTPDAIQIATGISEGAEFFLTNDNRLKMISEMKVLILDDFLS